jgi:hypothetical protein
MVWFRKALFGYSFEVAEEQRGAGVGMDMCIDGFHEDVVALEMGLQDGTSPFLSPFSFLLWSVCHVGSKKSIIKY